MLTPFPTPVLSIASDALKDLEGRDALLGLWNLFTKCKESLQDGRRLENISWRLWYREMKKDLSLSDRPPQSYDQTCRIICDMLPYSASNGNEKAKGFLKVPPPSMTTATRKLASVIPTPTVDSSNSLHVPPRLVVVDPTPNPTPHPTPHPTPPPSPLLASASVSQLQRQEKGRGKEHSNLNSKTKIKHSASSSASQAQKQEKGKGREHSHLNGKSKSKHSTHETLNSVSSALSAKVKRTLADPLLPGQHKRTIVLTTSESEYEHSDDDGSWSSEEMGSEDEEEGRRQDWQGEDRFLVQQQQQPLQQPPQRPSPVRRTQSSNQPHTSHGHAHAVNGAQRNQASRGHRQPPDHAQGQALRLAAEEAQRQRDMFVKKPTESFQNLTQVARTQSAGLLTQLLNQNPEPSHATPIPVLHPYNLPPPAPPSTPRTTRRLMLSTELSESLRRNLLWERQVSKVNLTAAVRRTASSGSRLSQLGGVQPLQPILTTVPSMVQLLPKGTMAHASPVGPVKPKQVSSEGDSGTKKERGSGGAEDHPGPSVEDEKEKEQKRRLAMARNRSWANDYHFAGW